MLPPAFSGRSGGQRSLSPSFPAAAVWEAFCAAASGFTNGRRTRWCSCRSYYGEEFSAHLRVDDGGAWVYGAEPCCVGYLCRERFVGLAEPLPALVRKRFRPLASGELSIREATYLAASGLAAAFGIAATIGSAAFPTLVLYAAATLSYSFFLKRVPILNVSVLAALYTFRLGFGIVLAKVLLSPWILVFSMLVFGSLSMAKRHTEVLRLAERGIGAMPGRGYIASDAPLTLGIGLASMLGAILIMVLYLIEDAFPRRGFYASPAFLWAIPPILFLFLGRIWLVSQRGQLQDDPVAFALKDRLSLLLGSMMGLFFAAALFIPKAVCGFSTGNF